MLLAAADALATMPVVAGLFADGAISWGEVRSVVRATGGLGAAQRGWVDEQLGADRQRLASLGADEVVAAVDELVAWARPEAAERDAERIYQRRFVSAQQAFDGSAQLYAELDAETAGTVLEALDAALESSRSRPVDPGEGGDDGGEAEDAAGMVSRRWGARRADALGDVASNYLAGGGRGPAEAKPSMLVVADVQTLDDGGDGVGGAAAAASGPGADGAPTSDRVAGGRDGQAVAELAWRQVGGPVRLTPKAVKRLACDARLRTVAVDGGAVLGESRVAWLLPRSSGSTSRNAFPRGAQRGTRRARL